MFKLLPALSLLHLEIAFPAVLRVEPEQAVNQLARPGAFAVSFPAVRTAGDRFIRPAIAAGVHKLIQGDEDFFALFILHLRPAEQPAQRFAVADEPLTPAVVVKHDHCVSPSRCPGG